MKKYILLILLLLSCNISFADSPSISEKPGLLVFGNISTKFGFGSYTSDHQIFIRMLPDANILIDGRTHPRAYTLGVLRFEHTPEIPGTRAINIDVDTTGQPDTHAVNVNFLAKGEIGDYFHIYDLHVDSAASTGGSVAGYSCGLSGDGTLSVDCLDVYAGVSPVEHHSGTPQSQDMSFTYDSGFTNVTAFFNYTASDTDIFQTYTSYIYLGHSEKFNDIVVQLETFAGGSGVKPSFEYSLGGSSWASLGASDGTNGFRQNGNIRWSLDGIPSWAVDTVNSVANKYWIRVKRTQNNLSPVPKEDKINIVVSTDYSWDSNGDVNVNTVTVTPFSKHHDITPADVVLGVTAPTTDTIGVARGLGFDADAETVYFSAEVPNEWVGTSDFTIHVEWAPTTAPADTETVKWDIEWRSVAEGEDIDGTSSSTASATYTQSGAGTAGELIVTDITVPYNDATNPLNIGDRMFFRFDRDVTGDTYSGGKAVVMDWDIDYSADSLSTH